MTGEAARVLALDVGLVRVGIAVSDPLGITAQSIGFFDRGGPRRDTAAVARLVAEHGAGTVVVGHPLLLSGEAGTRARDAESFAAALREALPRIAVELWDERFTTAEVERAMIAGGVRRRRRREVVDSLAAVLILQGYLEGNRPAGVGP